MIRRREETAATRSLLNTAKVMEDNPTALRLRELETLERVAERIDHPRQHGCAPLHRARFGASRELRELLARGRPRDESWRGQASLYVGRPSRRDRRRRVPQGQGCHRRDARSLQGRKDVDAVISFLDAWLQRWRKSSVDGYGNDRQPAAISRPLPTTAVRQLDVSSPELCDLWRRVGRPFHFAVAH